MRWLLAALVACSSTPQPPAKPAYCAPIDELGPYAHELFPGCPAPPLRFKVSLCGEPCALPCAVHWVSTTADGAGEGEEAYTYADGRLATATWLGHETRTCRYDTAGRLIEPCVENPLTARRDATGRIVAIGARELAYDDVGRLIRVGDNAITYDPEGRVVAYGTRRIEWDGTREVAEYFGTDSEPMRYDYDARGFLVREHDDLGSIDFTWDGNRLQSVVTKERRNTFRYDCNTM